VGQTRAHRLKIIICQILTDLKNVFTGRFFGKFAVKWILKIPPHLAYVATLPRETLMSAKQAFNDKLEGSVAQGRLRHINDGANAPGKK